MNQAQHCIDATSAKLDDSAEQVLIAATEAFLAPQGPWNRLWTANRELKQLISKNLRGVGEDGFASPIHTWREGMTEEEAMIRLIGLGGLTNEFINGPAIVIMDMQKKPVSDPVDVMDVQRLVQRFQQPSQVTKFQEQKVASLLASETSREACMRISNDIAQWLYANTNTIPQEAHDKMHVALGEYNHALADVLAYVDQAEKCLAVMPLIKQEAQNR